MNLYEDRDIGALIIECRAHNDEAFDELVRRYTPMMRKVISCFDSQYDFGELFSEACVALHSAAQRYDVEQGEVTFGLYARICVRNRIVDLLRSAEAAEGFLDCDVEQISDDESVEVGIVKRETIDTLLNSAKNLLSDYEYRVLILHIQGYKTAAIAKMLSRTAKSVDNAKSRLFRRLRAELGDISES
ncbi:MAG: sigma-70 family RNA polymerase sigma factor [Ruminococcaceae bacterium]|nr:sigma-70 family RNA polymerase sigma factor [Oscillospiraceae bacterium]